MLGRVYHHQFPNLQHMEHTEHGILMPCPSGRAEQTGGRCCGTLHHATPHSRPWHTRCLPSSPPLPGMAVHHAMPVHVTVGEEELVDNVTALLRELHPGQVYIIIFVHQIICFGTLLYLRTCMHEFLPWRMSVHNKIHLK